MFVCTHDILQNNNQTSDLKKNATIPAPLAWVSLPLTFFPPHLSLGRWPGPVLGLSVSHCLVTCGSFPLEQTKVLRRRAYILAFL